MLHTTESIIDKQISVYPNPSSDYLFIQLPNNEKLESLELYNVEGRRKDHKSIRTDFNSYKIDVSHLTQGLYFLKMQLKKNKTVTRTIIINR